MVWTLAYKLGSSDRQIGDVVSSIIDHNPSIVERPIHIQFNKLLVEPFNSLESLHAEGPIVIVFDTLDECGNIDEHKVLLKVLAEETANLPSFLCIIVTSQPEQDIWNLFKSSSHVMLHMLNI